VNFNLVFLVILCGVVIFMFLTKVWYHVVFPEMYQDLLTGCHLKNSCIFLGTKYCGGNFHKKLDPGRLTVYRVCILLHNHLSLFQEIFFNSLRS
jgi:hypothetical protein